MTKNLTMAFDEDLLKKARKIAVDKNTTVTGLIRTHLNNLVEQEKKDKKEIISELIGLFDRSKAVVGKKTWSREELHER
jgi:serine/threonine protein kinase HipA of HipAB toxin-antitoxin module